MLLLSWWSRPRMNTHLTVSKVHRIATAAVVL